MPDTGTPWRVGGVDDDPFARWQRPSRKANDAAAAPNFGRRRIAGAPPTPHSPDVASVRPLQEAREATTISF